MPQSKKRKSKLQRQFEERFPVNGAGLFAFARRLADPIDYGYWRMTVGSVYHVNDRYRKRKGWIKRLPDSAIYRHYLSGGDKSELLWYTSGLREIGGKTYALLMLDNDNKDQRFSAQEMDQVCDFLAALCGWSLLSQPSTGGKGRHSYLLTEVTGASPGEVKDLISELQAVISGKVAERFGGGIFDRINGSPVDGETGGSLAKLPLASSDQEAGAILEVLNLRKALRLREILEAIKGDPGETKTKKGRGWTGSTKIVSDGGDTWTRACTSVMEWRRAGYDGSYDDFYRWYDSKGHVLGNSDQRCTRAAYEWNSKNWKRPQAWTFQAALELAGGGWTGSTKIVSDGDSYRNLDLGQVAVFLHAFTTTILTPDPNKPAYDFTFSRSLGVQLCGNLDRYYLIRKYCQVQGWIVPLDQSYAKGWRSKRWGLGPAHPLYQTFINKLKDRGYHQYLANLENIKDARMEETRQDLDAPLQHSGAPVAETTKTPDGPRSTQDHLRFDDPGGSLCHDPEPSEQMKKGSPQPCGTPP